MVYAFFVGAFVGIPIGCYLREVGYVQKLKSAYGIFSAPPENQLDKFKNSSADFYKQLERGQADPKEFERYIYGGSFNQRAKDDLDVADEERKKLMKKIFS